MSTLFGCLRLTGAYPLDLSFLNLDKLEQGNHLHGFDTQAPRPFDYWLGGKAVSQVKQAIPARNTLFSGFSVKYAEDSPPKDPVLTFLTHSITAMRNDLDDDLAEASFVDKIFFHIYPKLRGRICLALDCTSAVSQFLLMTREHAMFFVSMTDKKSTYLLWSNESSLEQRLRDHFDQQFYFFRHQPLVNGVLVIQSRFLASKMAKWSRYDPLATLNALDVFLTRRTRVLPLDDEGTTWAGT